MTVANRRARSPRGSGEDLREALVAATAGLLETQDLNSLSVRTVTSATGVSPTALYLHFADLAELLRAVKARFFGELRDSLLAARIVRTLAETGIAPARLELEITESAFVADLDQAREALAGLRAAGVRIALDNFGTGYSSLYHLRSFRIDKVKIDRSFVRGVAERGEAASIVSALAGLGHGLGLTIAAEGVDGQEQEAGLLGSGCEQGQGRWFWNASAIERCPATATPTGNKS